MKRKKVLVALLLALAFATLSIIGTLGAQGGLDSNDIHDSNAVLPYGHATYEAVLPYRVVPIVFDIDAITTELTFDASIPLYALDCSMVSHGNWNFGYGIEGVHSPMVSVEVQDTFVRFTVMVTALSVDGEAEILTAYSIL